jgi:hypothetical protein
MNLLMNRRRLLKPLGGREWEKTILYQDYQPNRQAFSTDLSASDCDLRTDDTLFINIHLAANTGDRFEIFAVGNDISKSTDSGSTQVTAVNTSLIEWRWMWSGDKTQLQNRFGAYKSWFKNSSFIYTTLIPPHDYKIAFNKNGIAIDGVDVTSKYTTNNVTWNDILTYFYTTETFQVGSVLTKNGVTHSNQLINEVSIIHGFLTVNEMITITS